MVSVSACSQVEEHSIAAWFYTQVESELAAVQVSEVDMLITIQAKYQNLVVKAVLAPSDYIFYDTSLWLFMRDSFPSVAVSHTPISKTVSFLSSTCGQNFLALAFNADFGSYAALSCLVDCCEGFFLDLVGVTWRQQFRKLLGGYMMGISVIVVIWLHM